MHHGMAFSALTPVAFAARAAKVYADRPAVVDGALRYSYAELWSRARRLAGVLAGHGVRPGDRVAVLAPNTHVLLEAHYGVPLAGAVLVALNTRLAPAEIGYILEHSGARLVLVDAACGGALTETLGRCAARPRVIEAGGEPEDAYESLLAGADEHAVEVADERSLLSINYTSGTTGRPKGVMYHHRGAYLQALAMAYHAKLDTSSRYLWTLPMFHTNGWCFPWAVTAAGAVHHCLRGVSPPEIWRALRRDGVTHFCAAPTVLAMLAEDPAARVPLSRPVRVFAGGAPPWPSLLARTAALGIEVSHLYGLTETFGPAVVCEPKPEWRELPAEQRAPLMARQGIANVVAEPLRVAGPDGADVPADGETLGEILLRGNDVMLGYYRDEEATAAATTADGWFRTGDLGVLHPDGYVELRDRAKDLIISGGENITCVEVESALAEHPAVLEAAVVGAPHPRWGEVPVAYVVPRTAVPPGERELVAFVRERLAGFKAPRRIVFGELPKTSTGKIQKSRLREAAAHLALDQPVTGPEA
ncbi:AMP-binding protein [Streptomyces cacaoi]|uniref:Acyl-CoA synthetase n=1 Tax=Streptomyces cacaoi TaxID=1898 RepID=A0A4Y3QYT5_STRCI|nr:AMP-binding protein [Streptomyces cacaoi]NNG85906.1 AMP-binding protein [Streptomyces cacaoi]GEB49743.1 acyl-CoA synthetase [Streptomyces cacaoi]